MLESAKEALFLKNMGLPESTNLNSFINILQVRW